MRQGLGVHLLMCVVAFFLCFSCAMSEQPRRIRNVSTDELNRMIEGKIPLVLIDTRNEYEYKKGHLPGAISMAPYRFKEMGELLPPDKSIEVVFYCRGLG